MLLIHPTWFSPPRSLIAFARPKYKGKYRLRSGSLGAPTGLKAAKSIFDECFCTFVFFVLLLICFVLLFV